MQGDPGWGKALRSGWWELLVPLPFIPGSKAGRDSLTALRLVFLRAITAMALIIVVTRLVSVGGSNDDPSTSVGVFLAVIAVYGVMDLVMLVLGLRRTPDQGTDADGVATWFRTVSFLGYALMLGPFLVGFVGVFLTNEWAIVFAGLPFAAVAYWLAAPTRRRLRSAQEQLSRAGVSVDLVNALVSAPFTPGAASGARTRSDAGTETPPPS